MAVRYLDIEGCEWFKGKRCPGGRHLAALPRPHFLAIVTQLHRFPAANNRSKSEIQYNRQSDLDEYWWRLMVRDPTACALPMVIPLDTIFTFFTRGFFFSTPTGTIKNYDRLTCCMLRDARNLNAAWPGLLDWTFQFQFDSILPHIFTGKTCILFSFFSPRNPVILYFEIKTTAFSQNPRPKAHRNIKATRKSDAVIGVFI